jgi:tRNA pseudouridine32 synthase / 23S rRNA pseudouridine746 synthase
LRFSGALDSPNRMGEEELRDELARRVLYRDALMLVIDKPAGVPVHRGPASAAWKNNPSLEDAFDVLRFGLPRPPALAHRLDRDTSGCLVLGRHRQALETLGKLFKGNRVDKTYWAVVEGGPADDTGMIDMPLGRKDATRGWWMKPDPQGQSAQTQWRVLSRAGGMTWLALTPITGRTHQLRVHCAAMGWPIVGDAVYGSAVRQGGPALHLHARSVSVPLYPKREPISVEAPVPAHMAEQLAACSKPG